MTKMILQEVQYIGMCRDKGRGSQAFGWVDGAWSVIFPETVLRAWFSDPGTPGEMSSLYAVLGLKQDCAPDDIRLGHRRMALQWHPDRNKDTDAHSQFIRIQEAYNILSNPRSRAKYDAGLKFQASLRKLKVQQVDPSTGYRTPFTSGLIMFEGAKSGKWIIAEKILAWSPIVQGDRTLVSSWPRGAASPIIQWY